MIDVNQNLTVLSRLVFTHHISLVTSPDSIIAVCLQTSLSREILARGGGG